jgi:hypothetical protein
MLSCIFVFRRPIQVFSVPLYRIEFPVLPLAGFYFYDYCDFPDCPSGLPVFHWQGPYFSIATGKSAPPSASVCLPHSPSFGTRLSRLLCRSGLWPSRYAANIAMATLL